GKVDESAAHAARLIARLDSSGGRDATANEALALLNEPKALAAIAERLLSEDIVPGPNLDRLLRRAGVAAARALWSARVAQESTIERRARFVTWLIATGPGIRPVLFSALKRLPPACEVQAHADLT